MDKKFNESIEKLSSTLEKQKEIWDEVSNKIKEVENLLRKFNPPEFHYHIKDKDEKTELCSPDEIHRNAIKNTVSCYKIITKNICWGVDPESKKRRLMFIRDEHTHVLFINAKTQKEDCVFSIKPTDIRPLINAPIIIRVELQEYLNDFMGKFIEQLQSKKD